MRQRIVALLSSGMLLATAAVTATTAAEDARGSENDGARQSPDLVVPMLDVNGERIGAVRLEQKGDYVLIGANPGMLTPGFHGFHVHDIGICDPDAPDGPFTTAGGHYVGDGGTHGDHDGDMPSLLAKDDQGTRLRFRTDRFTVAELRAGNGSAIMIHAGRDNFANIPDRYSAGGAPGPDATTLATGDAGSRIACGVID